METLSKAQVSKRYGFNDHWVNWLISSGVLRVAPGSTPRRPRVEVSSLANLAEGVHYVVCRECGAYAGQIATLHLRGCSGMNLNQYVQKHPSAPILSSCSSENKAKTAEQKDAQSRTLKARFATPEGEVTRARISEAAKAMHANGYRDQAVAFLTRLNRTPERREALRRGLLRRWGDGSIRARLEEWRKENPERVLELVANARKSVSTSSKVHLDFKALFEEAGLSGFVTEFREGFYEIDEARPDLKLAVEVDGCYWHGCPACGFRGVAGTRRTDACKETYLRQRGWTFVRFWEHDIRRSPEGCLETLRAKVREMEVPR